MGCALRAWQGKMRYGAFHVLTSGKTIDPLNNGVLSSGIIKFDLRPLQIDTSVSWKTKRPVNRAHQEGTPPPHGQPNVG